MQTWAVCHDPQTAAGARLRQVSFAPFAAYAQ
jgi:hypothetical protein